MNVGFVLHYRRHPSSTLALHLAELARVWGFDTSFFSTAPEGSPLPGLDPEVDGQIRRDTSQGLSFQEWSQGKDFLFWPEPPSWDTLEGQGGPGRDSPLVRLALFGAPPLGPPLPSHPWHTLDSVLCWNPETLASLKAWKLRRPFQVTPDWGAPLVERSQPDLAAVLLLVGSDIRHGMDGPLTLRTLDWLLEHGHKVTILETGHGLRSGCRRQLLSRCRQRPLLLRAGRLSRGMLRLCLAEHSLLVWPAAQALWPDLLLEARIQGTGLLSLDNAATGALHGLLAHRPLPAILSSAGLCTAPASLFLQALKNCLEPDAGAWLGREGQRTACTDRSRFRLHWSRLLGVPFASDPGNRDDRGVEC